MKKLRLGRNKILLVATVLLLAVALVSILTFTLKDKKEVKIVQIPTQPRIGCINDEVGSLLGKNPQIFFTSELKLLQQAYDLSVKLPDDSKSLSCYYVETIFLYNTGQINESLQAYEKLDSLYKSETKYPDNIKNYAKTPEMLKKLIDDTQAENERIKENFNGTPIEESDIINQSSGQ